MFGILEVPFVQLGKFERWEWVRWADVLCSCAVSVYLLRGGLLLKRLIGRQFIDSLGLGSV